MTEHEIVKAQHINLFMIDKLVSQRKMSVEEVGDLVPSFFYVNNSDLTIAYLNSAGCKWMGLTCDEISKMGYAFFEEYLHPETIQHVFPRFLNFYRRQDPSKVYCDFQRVLDKRSGEYRLCFTATKLYKNHPGLFTITQPVDMLGPVARKLERMLDEEAFMRKHFNLYASLTAREKEVMRLLGQGLNNPQIADLLVISRKTVEQHRKNINNKLGIRSFVDVMKYVYAFDLV